MELFEGFVGIRMWEGQQVSDLLIALLLFLFISFALVFRFNKQKFTQMIKNAVFLKERHNLFDETTGSGGAIFHSFMLFQALMLCSLCLFLTTRSQGLLNNLNYKQTLITIGTIGGILFLFYIAKQFIYLLIGFVYTTPDKYGLWKKNYNAIMGLWGVLLYIPAIGLILIGSLTETFVLLFIIFYFLCRFVIIYKTIRIFHTRKLDYLYINLYLCAQEIIPLIFLNEGLILLYNFIETSTLWR